MKIRKILISGLFAIILVFACGRVEAANNNKLKCTISKNKEDGLDINIMYNTKKEYNNIYFYCCAEDVDGQLIRFVRNKLRATY